MIYVRHGYCNLFFITDTITLTLTYYSRVLNRFHTIRDDTKSRVNLDHCPMLSRLAISAREPNQPWIPSSDSLDQQDDVLHVHTMPSFGDRWGAKSWAEDVEMVIEQLFGA